MEKCFLQETRGASTVTAKISKMSTKVSKVFVSLGLPFSQEPTTRHNYISSIISIESIILTPNLIAQLIAGRVGSMYEYNTSENFT